MRSDQINTNVMFHDHICGHVGLLMKKKKKKLYIKKELRIMCLSIYRPQNNADLVTRLDNAPECESVNESEVRVLFLS